MPPVMPEKDTNMAALPATPVTPISPASAGTPVQPQAAMMPPKVLPSHSAPSTLGARPMNAPHQDIESLNKTLADKINPQATPTLSDSIPAGTPPMTPTEQPTVDTSVTPPPKKGGFNGKILIAIGLFLLTLIGGGTAYYLQTQNQDTRQRASYFQWDGKIGTTGLEIDVPDKSSLEKGYLNNGQYSGYKPASTNVSDPNTYYDVSKSETVNFSVPLKNTHEEPRGSKYRFFVYKINEANEGGQWVAVNQDWAKSEQEIYNIHNADKNNPSTGTRQSQVYDGGWQNFSIPSGQSGKIEGSWKPGNNDCGVYQLDVFVDDGSGDASLNNYNNIVGAGFIRVKGCTAPVQASCNMIDVADTVTLGSSVTVKVSGTNINTYDLYYAPVQANYCTTTVWKPVATGVASGEFSWNTAGLTAGKYIISGNAHGANDFHCSSNPSGACGTAFKECKQCGKEVTIVAPEAPGACNNITAPDSVTQGDKVTIKVNGTNLLTSKMYYSPTQASYCPVNGVNPWVEIDAGSITKGEFVWDTANIAPGSYYVAATAQLSATKWCSANPSIAQCASGFEACGQCGKPITIVKKPDTPVGGMCLNLCGVASPTANADFSGCPAGGGKVGTAKLNEYVHFKCNYSGSVGTVSISVSKDGGAFTPLTATQNGSAFTASYRIPSAGTYAARCDVTSASTTGSTTTTPPTTSGGTTTQPSINEQKKACQDSGGQCNIGSCARYQTPVNNVSCPNTIDGKSMICCKDNPDASLPGTGTDTNNSNM